MKAWLSRIAALIFLLVVAAYPAYTYLWPAEKFEPPLSSDLAGKVVAVPAKNNELYAWQFDASDSLQVKQLDFYVDNRKKIVYAEVNTSTSSGYRLNGILEAHYTKIADKHYMVALGSITLNLTEPPQAKPDKKPEKKQSHGVEQSQTLPGGKQ